MTIQELIEKRAKAWDNARDFLDSKRNSSGLLSEEDSKTYDKMEAEIVALGKEIQRLERLSEIDAELSKPTSTPILNQPTTPDITDKNGTASSTYSETFWNSVRSGDWKTVKNVLQVGKDIEGGYLVPDEFEKRLVEKLTEDNFMRRICTIIKTSSGDRQIPIVTSDGEAYQQGEGSKHTESDIVFGQAVLSAYKLTASLRISEELLNDSAFDLKSYTATNFSRRIAAKEEEEEEAFIIGTGAGSSTGDVSQPTGFLNAVGGAENGVTTTKLAVTTDDLIDLFYSLKSPYRKNAVWILNDTTVKAVRKLTDSNGNYLWQPAISANAPDTILGRPYYTSAYVPEIKAGAKAVAFGDFSYYWIADRQGFSLKCLNELYSENDQIGFKASKRVDGKLILPEAVKTLTLKSSS